LVTIGARSVPRNFLCGRGSKIFILCDSGKLKYSEYYYYTIYYKIVEYVEISMGGNSPLGYALDQSL
jgi:hypothetical protein